MVSEENLKSILEIVLFQNSVRDYLLALATLIGFVFVFLLLKRFLVYHLGNIEKKTVSDFDDFIVGLISQIGLLVFTVTALYIATLPLVLAETVRSLIRYLLIIVVTIRAILLLQDIVRYSVDKIYKKRIHSDGPSVNAMVKSITGILRWVIWIMGTIFVLDNLGINVSALMAGIGIGGVAVALASQAVLGDAFSALSIFLDRPFEIGDFIIIDDHMGTVEHIGIKTTRIRSLYGEQLILSNSDLTKSRIKNYKRMEMRRVAFKIGVVYQTSLENVRKIPLLVKDIFSKVEGVKLDRAHFQSFGDFSLIYEIVYYVPSADYNIYMDKQQEINFALMETFERKGIIFAYPTQMLYVKKEA